MTSIDDSGGAFVRRTGSSHRRVRAAAAVTAALTALAMVGAAPAMAATDPPAAPPAPVPAASDTVEIDVVTINDFHGRIEADRATAGAAVLAGAVEHYRTQNPNTVFAAAGDLIGASTFTSFIQGDEPTIDALNAAGLDVSAAGNHEFDQGWADLRDRVQNRADWEYISSNVFLAGTNDTALAPSWVTEFEGVRVGFVGAVTEDSRRWCGRRASPTSRCVTSWHPSMPPPTRCATATRPTARPTS